jgi:phosphate transport system substrate-binding protein
MPIVVFTRPDAEVDAEVAIAGMPCMQGLKPHASVRVIDRPDELAREVAGTAGAIGLTSMPMVEQSSGAMRAVALDGVAPTPHNVGSGTYPLARKAILVHREPPPPVVREFLSFVASAEGDRIIRLNGGAPAGRQ